MQMLQRPAGLRSIRQQRQHKRPVVLRFVAEADVEAEKKAVRKPGPLEKGGTLAGELAAGKDAGATAKAAFIASQNIKYVNTIVEGKYRDDRWVEGRWNLMHPGLRAADGATDWDKVIDAEIARRKLLEDNPIPSINEEPVLFDTAEIPFWIWIKRFHLPEAEKLNGRAAMMGYVLAGGVDLISGAGLVDQQESFFGKLALHLCVFAILAVRNTKDLDNYKNLIDEATFYDKQWNATWEGAKRPSESNK